MSHIEPRIQVIGRDPELTMTICRMIGERQARKEERKRLLGGLRALPKRMIGWITRECTK